MTDDMRLSGRALKSDELLALAARCEREEPSRELDAAIWTALTGKPAYTEGEPFKAGNPPRRTRLPIPTYTTSLDAAVTLVPEGDDVFWRSGHDGTGPDPSLFKAEVLVCRLSVPPNGFVARARTEPMARVAAALRARAHLKSDEQ